jgi:hypothetical protein
MSASHAAFALTVELAAFIEHECKTFWREVASQRATKQRWPHPLSPRA